MTDFIRARREKVERHFFAIQLKLCRRVKAVLPTYIKFGFIHALQVYQQVAFQLFSVQWVYTTIFRKLNERVFGTCLLNRHPTKIGHTETFSYNIVVSRACAATHKNWSAPGIDGIQNFWWKKFQGVWKALVRSFNEWIEQPDRIPEWVTHGRTVLLPKLEDLSDEKEYRPITCLNTCYKIFTGNVGSYMKEHAERNSIWDRSQLGTCSGVLGTVDQLIVDNTIMDEVRGKRRNLAVAFYDYRKAYDMVRHDWMLRVYRWMGVPEKVVNVLSQLMEGWKTRLEVTDKGKLRPADG